VRDEAERIVHVVIHHDDVTVEKRARDALGRSEASFRALIEESPDGIFVARGGRIVFVNAAAIALLGYARRDDLIGRAVEEIFPPRDRVETGLSILRMEAQGMPLAPRETTLCRRDGGSIDADVVGLSVSFNGDPAAVLIARDISGRKRLQAGLAIADRMVALGTLVDVARPEVSYPARRDAPHSGLSAEVERVMDASIHLAGGHLRSGARMVKSYGTTPLVQGSETRLVQVFLNLLLNTAEGIPAGEADRHTIEVRTGTDERGRAQIEIRDEFAGIPAEIGRSGSARPGAGLGLSIAHNIITSLGGEIEVAGELEAGPRIRVFLPPAKDVP
jgi:PAS domain S-box-containing protein